MNQLPNIKIVEKDDTAASAREIQEKGLKGHAAICSRLQQKCTGLTY